MNKNWYILYNFPPGFMETKYIVFISDIIVSLGLG